MGDKEKMIEKKTIKAGTINLIDEIESITKERRETEKVST